MIIANTDLTAGHRAANDIYRQQADMMFRAEELARNKKNDEFNRGIRERETAVREDASNLAWEKHYSDQDARNRDLSNREDATNLAREKHSSDSNFRERELSSRNSNHNREMNNREDATNLAWEKLYANQDKNAFDRAIENQKLEFQRHKDEAQQLEIESMRRALKDEEAWQETESKRRQSLLVNTCRAAYENGGGFLNPNSELITRINKETGYDIGCIQVGPDGSVALGLNTDPYSGKPVVDANGQKTLYWQSMSPAQGLQFMGLSDANRAYPTSSGSRSGRSSRAAYDHNYAMQKDASDRQKEDLAVLKEAREWLDVMQMQPDKFSGKEWDDVRNRLLGLWQGVLGVGGQARGDALDGMENKFAKEGNSPASKRQKLDNMPVPQGGEGKSANADSMQDGERRDKASLRRDLQRLEAERDALQIEMRGKQSPTKRAESQKRITALTQNIKSINAYFTQDGERRDKAPLRRDLQRLEAERDALQIEMRGKQSPTKRAESQKRITALTQNIKSIREQLGGEY